MTESMKIIRLAQEVAEGWYPAHILAGESRKTRKGKLSFLRCRITSGKYEGREVSFLIPPVVKEGTHFDRFLVSVLGSLGVWNDVDLQVLVNKAVAIRVARVRKGKRSYCNVVAISPPEREEETEVGG